MKFAQLFLPCLAASATVSAAAVNKKAASPPYFILIGDSTVTDNAGWGGAFVDLITGGAEGDNRAVSGRTAESWQANGRWDALFKTINETVADWEPIVTIQFGHNDQKAVTVDEYQASLEDMTTQLKDAGATPIVISPITRRNWYDGVLREDFVEWRKAAKLAATHTGCDFVDLTTASTTYVKAIGEEDSQYYNYGDAGTDGTHLNAAGAKVFSRMVSDLLLDVRADLGDYIAANAVLSGLIADGEFATGDEE